MKCFHTVTTDCESFVGTKDTILRRLKTVTLVCIGFDYMWKTKARKMYLWIFPTGQLHFITLYLVVPPYIFSVKLNEISVCFIHSV